MLDRILIPLLKVILWTLMVAGALASTWALTIDIEPGARYPELSKLVAVLYFALPTALVTLGLLLVTWWGRQRRGEHGGPPTDTSPDEPDGTDA